jgi:RNA 3'-terminal phosphate cyclase (ATP)
MIDIDGSFGEGGGQILRTSLSLSLVTGQAFRIRNIRAHRERSGLLRQHLTAVLAAAEVGQAQVEGATLGSRALSFQPGTITGGSYHFAVGTAGSGTLVFQTVLPALMMIREPSHLTIEGGTHNPGAPPFDFIERAFLPIINRMGPQVHVELSRYGFYPAGGGRFTASITPAASCSPIHLDERGAIPSRGITVILANLPRHIATREIETAAQALDWGPDCSKIVSTKNSASPGNTLLIEVQSAAVTEIFSAHGQLGVPAETVAQEAAREAGKYLASEAVLGDHLTDQVLLPLALAGSGSFTATDLTLHSRTNMEVIQQFLPVRFATEQIGTGWRVQVSR